MSAPSSLKIPLRPEWEAMASMRRRMVSNAGPAVSVRTKRSLRLWICRVSGSYSRTVARGFSPMFRRLLLKNWNERATWREST